MFAALCVFFLSVASPRYAYASSVYDSRQSSRIVKGVVKDQNGEPLVGAAIAFKSASGISGGGNRS